MFGRVAKWLNAADCNSAPNGSAVRIRPLPPLLGYGQAVKAPDFDSGIDGSSPSSPAIFIFKKSIIKIFSKKSTISVDNSRIT